MEMERNLSRDSLEEKQVTKSIPLCSNSFCTCVNHSVDGWTFDGVAVITSAREYDFAFLTEDRKMGMGTHTTSHWHCE